MNNEKKIWFTGISRTLWIPKSIEGWSVTVAVILALYLIVKINEISDDIPFIFSQHWPMLLELALVFWALYSVTKGHVDKKY
jgi:hypothetical protein